MPWGCRMKKTCIICDACGQVAVGMGYATLAASLRRKGWTIFSTHKHFCPACRDAAHAHDDLMAAMRRGKSGTILPRS